MPFNQYSHSMCVNIHDATLFWMFLDKANACNWEDDKIRDLTKGMLLLSEGRGTELYE